jgi:hypothetical protein
MMRGLGVITMLQLVNIKSAVRRWLLALPESLYLPFVPQQTTLVFRGVEAEAK